MQEFFVTTLRQANLVITKIKDKAKMWSIVRAKFLSNVIPVEQ
jgi:hypothetical protein